MNTSIFFIILLKTYVSSTNVSIPIIFGGKPAREGQFPHQARIQMVDGKIHCSGSIISDRWILTARHCLVENYSYLQVLVGSVIAGEGDCYEIEKGVGYDGPDWHTDIAMMKVTEEIKFNENTKTIKIGKKKVGKGVKVTISGWGLTENGYPSRLLYVRLKTLSNKDCNEKLSKTVLYPLQKTDLCAFARKNKGVCYGDSGSGLISGKRLVGVVSRGIPCADGFPDIFIRVFYFRSWIKENMNT